MSIVRRIFDKVLGTTGYDRIKIIYLSLAYFAVIGGYTVLRELRDVVFVNIVGREYIQVAQLMAMIILIPLVLLDSFFIDRLKRHQLLYVYSTFYVIGTLLIVYFVGHSTIGIANTDVSAYRFFGWLIYFFC